MCRVTSLDVQKLYIRPQRGTDEPCGPRLSSPSIEGMDVSGLLSMMEAMGLPESVWSDFSEDPLSFMQKAMSQKAFSDTDDEEDEEKDIFPGLDCTMSRLRKDVEDAK